MTVTVACSSSDEATPKTQGDAGSTGAETGPDPQDECANAPPPAPKGDCTNTKCSAQLGEPATCVNNQCVKLKSDLCPNVLGAADDDDAIFFGTLLSLTGANASSGLNRQNSVQLAVDEINNAGGIPSADKCAKPRKLAFVGCDDQPDEVKAANHLTTDLGFAAVIGAGTSGKTVNAATKSTIPAKALLFAPSSTAISITGLAASPDGVRLVWRAAPSDVIQSKAMELVIGELAGKVTGTVKLAIISKSDAYGVGLDSELRKNLKFNGAGYDDPANASNRLTQCFNPSPAAGQQPTSTDACPVDKTTAAAVTALKGLQPDIIVLNGTAEAITEILVPYEASAEGQAKKPLYMIPDGPRKTELITAVTASPELRTRIRGTVPGTLTTLGQDFFSYRYTAAHPDNPQLVFGMAGSYDATYMIAYSIASGGGKQPITGTSIASGFTKLIAKGSTSLDVGPAKINTGFSTLVSGGSVDFNGASGPLDFNPQTGEADSDFTVWCISNDPNTNKPYFNDATSQSYDATAKALKGTFICP
ncbi:Branched-chain amino acid ABC transporter, amino acid-binding protein [Labilithrix luteola]|uniref:Branched-chain amino acid ABC transporter, amino acid-binding protein n=2 Tax=Labilithrix luteola TaxID=1391654 RepID=A0A0K1QBC0_9BACT|nr:Branched-chain amino acid ABC transporter, amino acid-binding protein [Labilithrix luteola]